MKSPVNVTLILMGTLLILAPVVADFLFQHNVVELLAHFPTANPGLTLTTSLSIWTRVAYRLGGTVMILVAVIGALVNARNSFYVPSDLDEDEDQDEDDE